MFLLHLTHNWNLGNNDFQSFSEFGIRFQVSDGHINVPVRSQNIKCAISPTYLQKCFPPATTKINDHTLKAPHGRQLVKFSVAHCCGLGRSLWFRDALGEHL